MHGGGGQGDSNRSSFVTGLIDFTGGSLGKLYSMNRIEMAMNFLINFEICENIVDYQYLYLGNIQNSIGSKIEPETSKFSFVF